MSEFGWRSEVSVEAWLRAQPYCFDFFQAVKILETLSPHSKSPAAASDPELEPVRFRSQIGLEFPSSDIAAMTTVSEGHGASPPEMAVTFLSLAGALGPLPLTDTERLLEQARKKDFAFRDFLDVFHHRLISLFYRVRRMHHVALTSAPPETTPMARYLYSCFGLGLPALRERTIIPDKKFLYYAGLLSQQPRSAAGLEQLLSHHFPLPDDRRHHGEHRTLQVKVRQFTGKWLPIASDQWTFLGPQGQNQRIGQDVVLGTRVWSQSARFEICLGPVPVSQFLNFLPTGSAFRSLCELTRFYAGSELDFTIRLILQKTHVPPLQIGQARLGWTSWIREQPFTQDDSQVCLDPKQTSVS